MSPRGAFLAGAIALVAAVQPAGAQVLFTEVSDAVGVGSDTYQTAIEHGLGISWIDVNDDGWPDLFVTNGFNRDAHLFLNDGAGAFANVDNLLPALPNVELMGSVFADYDNDGDSDLYVFTDNEVMESVDGPPNLLLKNLFVESGRIIPPGVPLFVDVAPEAGVDDLADPPFGAYPAYRSTTGGWLDYDRDGDVDLYVAHWAWRVPGQAPNADRLFRNNGDGTFTDVTTQVGIHWDLASDSENLRPALAFIAAHLDGDLWPDMYVSNVRDQPPFHHDFLYRNDGDGTFSDVTADSPGVGDDTEADMGLTVSDVELDGDWDFYISDLMDTNLDEEPLGNAFYLGNGDGTFGENSAVEAGIDGDDSWGVNFFDVDRDGYEDLFVAVTGMSKTSLLFMNDKDATFTEQAVASGITATGKGRGSSVADYDRDGDLDLAVVYEDGELKLYRNDSINARHWLALKLRGTVSNRDAIGALVRVTASSRVLMRQVLGGSSIHGQDDLDLFFGIGQATRASKVEVFWPGGLVNTYTNVNADQRLELRENLLSLAGLFDPERDRFLLRNVNAAGAADIIFEVNTAVEPSQPFAGDWDGDLIETVGLFDPDTEGFFLWNDHDGGPADVSFNVFAEPGAWLPVAGDWNADGFASVGIYNQDTKEFRLWNENIPEEPADITFFFLTSGSNLVPIAGDWDGDGITTVGVWDAVTGRFVLTNALDGTGGFNFRFGPTNATGWTPLGGDWNGDGIDSIGLYRPDTSTFQLRNTNSNGPADLTFAYGPAGRAWAPLVGRWHSGIVQ